MSVIPFKITLKDQESIKVEKLNIPHFYSLLHFHPEYQITFIEKGRGTLYFGENARTFKEGDIYLIGTNVSHVFIDYSMPGVHVQGISAVTIFFPKEYVEHIFSIIIEADHIRTLLKKSQYCIKVGNDIKRLVAKLILEIADIPVGFERILKLMYILHYISMDFEQLSITSTVELSDSGNRIERIFKFTIENYAKEIKLSQVAALINMTETSFCRFFKQSTGKSYMQFLIEIRIGMSCKKMVSDYCNLSEIAFDAGFNSMTNFIKQFKRVMNVTPSEYRQLLHKNINVNQI